MAQIFHHSANTLARVSLLCVIVLPALLILSGSAISRSPWNTKVGIAKDQPVPFSHEHHAVELGIDCRYCHTSVEKEPYANVPPTATCYTCHSQVWTNSPLLEPVRYSVESGTPLRWNQLHSVPDFVYFNHAVHINRGVNCNVCHGAIQKEMITYKGKPFFMAWCLNCHRNPEEFIGEQADVWALYDKYQRYQPGDKELPETLNIPGEEPEKMTPEQRTIFERMKAQTLTPEQHALADGMDYTRTQEELSKGKERLLKYKVKTEQLTDCWICHR